jgi:hypothetical protein
MPEEPTRNEAHFLEQFNIERIVMPLNEFVAAFQKEQTVH